MQLPDDYNTNVRAARRARLSDETPWQKLQLFPTPPWATRALFYYALSDFIESDAGLSIWEPCAGLGHMSAVLGEYATRVLATDIYDYRGEGLRLVDFTNLAAVKAVGLRPDWVMTNPAFKTMEAVLNNALEVARVGVALIARIQWREGAGRYRRIFATPRAPTLIAPFAGRVAMCEGGYDPDGDTATTYAWFIWVKDERGSVIHPAGIDWARGEAKERLIPPDAEGKLFKSNVDRAMSAWSVPGFIPPSILKKQRERDRREVARLARQVTVTRRERDSKEGVDA